MFLNRAREPYEPNMSAAMMTPPVNLTPRTDVPVTMGLLRDRQLCSYQQVLSVKAQLTIRAKH